MNFKNKENSIHSNYLKIVKDQKYIFGPEDSVFLF